MQNFKELSYLRRKEGRERRGRKGGAGEGERGEEMEGERRKKGIRRNNK